jgi:hypothetical protein
MKYYITQTSDTNTVFAVSESGEVVVSIREDNSGQITLDTNPAEKFTDTLESKLSQTREIDFERFDATLFQLWWTLCKDIRNLLSRPGA